MPVKVKICGITRLDDALYAYKLGTWALGFIFYPSSPRAIAKDHARNLIHDLPDDILKIGVFVNEDHHVINDMQESLGLSYVQLHGDEQPDFCTLLKGPYIKALRPRYQKDITVIPNYRDASMILIDAASPLAYGGTGQKADWSLVQQAKKYNKPIILSGGLNEANIQNALKVVHPDYIDLSSGVEESPGIKDHSKMNKFFERLRYEEQ